GDHDSEVRAQAVRMLGDMYGHFEEVLGSAVKDAEPRVRYFAALALSRKYLKIQRGDKVPARDAVLEMLRENADEDPYLRYAGVMALTRLIPHQDVDASNESTPVRLAITLALRGSDLNEEQETALMKRVYDVEPRVAVEAIRAIHDLPPTPERLKLYSTV